MTSGASQAASQWGTTVSASSTTVASGPPSMTATSSSSAALTHKTNAGAQAETVVETSILLAVQNWKIYPWLPAIKGLADLMRKKDDEAVYAMKLVAKCEAASSMEGLPEAGSALPGRETVSHLADIIYETAKASLFDYSGAHKAIMGTAFKKGGLLQRLKITRYGVALDDRKVAIIKALGDLRALLQNQALRTAVDDAIRARHLEADRDSPAVPLQYGGPSYGSTSTASGITGGGRSTFTTFFSGHRQFYQRSSRDDNAMGPADSVLYSSQPADQSSQHGNTEDLSSQALLLNEWRDIAAIFKGIITASWAVHVQMAKVSFHDPEAESTRQKVVAALEPYSTWTGWNDAHRPTINYLVTLIRAFFLNIEEAEFRPEIETGVIHCLSLLTSMERAWNLQENLSDALLHLRPALSKRLQDIIRQQLIRENAL
jgi:hypothetical protein